MEELHKMINIAGFNKLTLLDYPEHNACIIFTQGCNYKCSYCHNASLIKKSNKSKYKEEEIFDFLNKRKKVLEGVCISGGEPLMQPNIIEFIKKIKELNYKIKIDTNGAYPDMLKKLLDNNLIDYVAMDIKHDINKYNMITKVTDKDLNNVKKSIDILLNSNIDYEFRTTIVKEIHKKEDIINIVKMIKQAKRYYLQNFMDSGNIMDNNFNSFSKKELIEIKKEIKKYITNVEVRGI